MTYICVVVNTVDIWKWCFWFSIISINNTIWEGDFSHLFLCLHKVEDADDIQNIPSTVAGGAEAEEQSSIHQDVKNEAVQQMSASKVNTSELPPYIVLEMPALSPTMVRKFVFRFLNFLASHADFLFWPFLLPIFLSFLYLRT